MSRQWSWFDWGVPAALAGVLTAEAAIVQPRHLAVVLAIELVACAVLVYRRRWTVVSCLLSGWLIAVTPFAGSELEELAAPILVIAVVAYTLARWLPDHRGLLVLAAIALGITSDYLFTDERDNDVTDVFFVLSLLTPPYVLGRIARRLALQSEQLAAQQELVRQTAIRDERDRIARELHDVVAHSVSAMVVQVAAAQDLVRTDPDRAESVLADVAATGREALAETGRLLHLIRDTDGELGLTPAPGLAEVPALVDGFRADGLDVDLRMDDSLRALPPGVDVSAYRIVQEALTNALRYAADRRAIVSVSGVGSGDERVVRIHAANRCNGHEARGSGLGLIGMHERVTLLGGTFSHGMSSPGVFEIEAKLPVGT